MLTDINNVMYNVMVISDVSSGNTDRSTVVGTDKRGLQSLDHRNYNSTRRVTFTSPQTMFINKGKNH